MTFTQAWFSTHAWTKAWLLLHGLGQSPNAAFLPCYHVRSSASKTLTKTLRSTPPKRSWRKALPCFKMTPSASPPLSANMVPCCQALPRLSVIVSPSIPWEASGHGREHHATFYLQMTCLKSIPLLPTTAITPVTQQDSFKSCQVQTRWL